MSAPPPPPPPPRFTASAAAPLPKGATLANLLSTSSLTNAESDPSAGSTLASAAPDVVKASVPAPASSKKAPNAFMDELAGRIGSPRESGEPETNPSMVVPGYRAPPGLPSTGGTQGHDMVHYAISGPALVKVQAAAEFQLHCLTPTKEPVDLPISILAAEITQNKEKGETSMGKIERTDQKGVLKVTFRARMTGEYHIQLYVKGALEQRPVYEPPGLPLQVVAAEPTLKETLLFSVAGHGLYGGAVGQTLSFEILVKNEAGTLRDVDRDRLRVMLVQGLKKAEGDVERLSEGTYKAEIRSFGPGDMLVKVQYGGQDVIETGVTFSAGIDAATTEVIGFPTKAPIGQQQTFQIQAKDAAGNKVTTGGEKFDLGVSGPKGGVTGLVVRDELTGIYTVRFTLTAAGDYGFHLNHKGKPLTGTPFKVKAE